MGRPNTCADRELPFRLSVFRNAKLFIALDFSRREIPSWSLGVEVFSQMACINGHSTPVRFSRWSTPRWFPRRGNHRRINKIRKGFLMSLEHVVFSTRSIPFLKSSATSLCDLDILHPKALSISPLSLLLLWADWEIVGEFLSGWSMISSMGRIRDSLISWAVNILFGAYVPTLLHFWSAFSGRYRSFRRHSRPSYLNYFAVNS